MKSFIEAEKKGFNIELDVRITKDNELVVLHDRYINNIAIEELNYIDLVEIEKLSTVINHFENKETKILVELKSTKKRKILQNKTFNLVEDMDNIAIISFDPRIVKFFSGKTVIGMSFDKNNYLKFRLDILIISIILKPDFLILHKSIEKNKELKFLKIPFIYWTIKNKSELNKNINHFIFDSF